MNEKGETLAAEEQMEGLRNHHGITIDDH